MKILDKNEDLLSLGLGTVNSSTHVERKLKRKRIDVDSAILISLGKDYEGKIRRLIQERRQMLNMKQKGKGALPEGSGLHLIHLLLVSATLINDNNSSSAVDNLTELYRYVSVLGDSEQRVAAYFTDALTARLLTPKSSFYSTVISKPSPTQEFIGFTHLYRVSPLYQFAHFTANQAILEAFDKEEGKNNGVLHVVDFDISHGFQWPSLIQSLSEKATTSGHSILFVLTGMGNSIQDLTNTEIRLANFCRDFPNIEFEFHALLRRSKMTNLQRRVNETIAVNLVFYLSSLTDIVQISDTLTSVNSLSPCIVLLAEKEGSKINCGILSSYVDALHYYAAMFDSLDDCLPLQSVERVAIERDHLGKEIKEAVAVEGVRCSRFETLETWKGRMESHRLVGTELSSKVNIQAKLLLKMRSHYNPRFEGEGGGGYRVYERDDGRAISLGWQDRILVTASSWRPR